MRMLSDPLLERGLRLELLHLNAVDSGAEVPDQANVLFAHLANPHHPIALQAAAVQVDGSFIQGVALGSPLG